MPFKVFCTPCGAAHSYGTHRGPGHTVCSRRIHDGIQRSCISRCVCAAQMYSRPNVSILPLTSAPAVYG
jgi:hypothetical protein